LRRAFFEIGFRNGSASYAEVVETFETVEELCPAKVNLFLAVTGKRPDGFHDLLSLMVPLDHGDTIRVAPAGGAGVSLRSNDPSLPCDENNLVLRAVAAYRHRHPFRLGLDIELEKRIPAGAGLGGGSSDAAGTLRALNRLLGQPLSPGDLHSLAAGVGSDCPFFLQKRAAVARGRGELLESLPAAIHERLVGQRLLLLKPQFPVPTAWAYGAMQQRRGDYIRSPEAEARLEAWLGSDQPISKLLYNNMEPAVMSKFIPLAVLKEQIHQRFGLPVLMSGSGSSLIVLLEAREEHGPLCRFFREACGPQGWVVETAVAAPSD
jgi:4-diphosphocytidyl-2-C-methyl-D-erythritol kinase